MSRAQSAAGLLQAGKEAFWRGLQGAAWARLRQRPDLEGNSLKQANAQPGASVIQAWKDLGGVGNYRGALPPRSRSVFSTTSKVVVPQFPPPPFQYRIIRQYRAVCFVHRDIPQGQISISQQHPGHDARTPAAAPGV